MTKRDKLKAKYKVGNKPVTVGVTIGNGQFGRPLMLLDYITVGTDRAQFDGKRAKGKKLLIKTVVTDVNDKTNKLSVKYTLRGGAKAATIVRKLTVAKNGDAAIFDAEIRLT